MRRTLAALVMMLALAAPALAQKIKPPLVDVFFAAQSVETDRAQGLISQPPPELKTLINEFTRRTARGIKHDAVRPVTDKNAASAQVVFVGLASRLVAGSHLLSWSATSTEWTASAVVIGSDFRKELSGIGAFKEAALNEVAVQIETFVRDNRARLIARQ